MKKRTVCFGWTKKFQRTMRYAADLMRGGHHAGADVIANNVKAAHSARVKQLRGVA